jgi:hypothetical protein
MSNLTHLRAPFPASRIEWRIQSCGTKSDGSVWARCLAYIDNRAAMERLDEVYGEGWSHKEEFKQIGTSAVCTVTMSFGDRTVCGSCEVELNKGDDIDPFKSAASGAMKRAVVNLGIGRYLYELPEAWAVITDSGKYQGKTKDGTKFKWNPPDLDAPVEQYERIAAAPTPAPRAPSVQPVSGGDWKSVIIPFGKLQGKTLGSLPAASLKWWQDNYQPKPFKGAISAKDQSFRDALDQSLGVTSAPTIETPDDDVPF